MFGIKSMDEFKEMSKDQKMIENALFTLQFRISAHARLFFSEFFQKKIIK